MTRFRCVLLVLVAVVCAVMLSPYDAAAAVPALVTSGAHSIPIFHYAAMLGALLAPLIFGAIAMPDPGATGTKWSGRAAAAGPAYTAGVTGNTDYATKTVNAAPTWAAGVQAAVANNSFGKGVSKAGQSKWQAAAAGKGAQRFPAGVQGPAPTSAYTSGVTPYFQALASVTLPPKGPKGAPQNYANVQTIGDVLHQKKLALMGS